jgi:glycosyltransferase involved in cell wall biosynthesis
MATKKVVQVIEKYFIPVTAGIEVNMHETYKVLAREGWDVTFHTSKDTLTEKNVLPDNEVISNMSVRRYKFGQFGYFPTLDWDRSDYVCLHNFNIFPHFLIMGYSLLRKLLGKKHYKLILTPHGGFTPEWAVFPPSTRIIKYIYHFTLGTLLINLIVDGVRAVSEWERVQIVSKGVSKNKVIVIANGLEDEAFSDVDTLASSSIKGTVASLGRYILQIGRVYPIKNYETTLKALVNVPTDVKYVIAGPIELNAHGKYMDKLKQMIKDLGLSDRVVFLGVVKGVDKYYLIKHAEMMVHMALWESFCNVVHEGLSQGLVCIVANNTALPYLIKNGENGYLINTFDSKSLADRINFVLNDTSGEVVKIQESNKKLWLKHSWVEVAHNMKDYYLSL